MRAFKIVPKTIVQSASLSKEALTRLSWFDWYYSHGKNAEATCRHFNVSKSVFYRWKNRFNPGHLQTLEFDTKTRRSKKVREMTTPLWIQKRIFNIRITDLEKSKYEIQAELKDEGIIVGRKCIQKVINRNPELKNVYHKEHLKLKHK